MPETRTSLLVCYYLCVHIICYYLFLFLTLKLYFESFMNNCLKSNKINLWKIFRRNSNIKQKYLSISINRF